MPIYDYECRECGQRLEVFSTKPVSSKTLECKLCGGVMDKKVSVPSKPQFKGSGFYETDFKRK